MVSLQAQNLLGSELTRDCQNDRQAIFIDSGNDSGIDLPECGHGTFRVAVLASTLYAARRPRRYPVVVFNVSWTKSILSVSYQKPSVSYQKPSVSEEPNMHERRISWRWH